MCNFFKHWIVLVDPSTLPPCRPLGCEEFATTRKEVRDNDLLFSMFLDEMKNLCNRELELTQDQCSDLVKHIAGERKAILSAFLCSLA